MDFRCWHVEVDRPGELLSRGTFSWNTLEGVRKIWVQVVADVYCSSAFGKVYTSKLPAAACDLLPGRVLPFYEALGVELDAVLADNGRASCGRPENHPYELLLALEGVTGRREVRSPQTNGFVERTNRTLFDEASGSKGPRPGTWRPRRSSAT